MLHSEKAWQRGFGHASYRLWIKILLKTTHIVKFLTGGHLNILSLYAKHETTYNGTQSKDVRHAGQREANVCL